MIDGSGITLDAEQPKVTITPTKKRKRMFISEEEFNRIALKQLIPWSNLSHGRIYKLEWINNADQQIAGNLTNVDGITVSVLLPQFVVDKLLAIIENNIRIYVMPHGEDHVDIAAIKRN